MERTIIRRFETKAVLIGPPGPIAETITLHFEAFRVRVLHLASAGEACEALATAMPQVVVVLGSLEDDEREALAEHATAIGALVSHLDPALDLETLETMTKRIAQLATDRRVSRELSGGEEGGSEPPPGSADLDSGWNDTEE